MTTEQLVNETRSLQRELAELKRKLAEAGEHLVIIGSVGVNDYVRCSRLMLAGSILSELCHPDDRHKR
jgi:hypothetical protein